jgi:5-oxoprolinase (ATP-hydrolysing) subunit A
MEPDMRHLDLNCDLGESFGAYAIGADAELMATITSANIACGFHAGDPAVMRQTVRLAATAGVAVGAHPGLPDLVGFGRREMRVTPQEVEDMVLYQVGALTAIASAEGLRLHHVKAHGALYNMAARDRGLAEALVRAVRALDPRLIVFGPPGSELLRAASAAGLVTASEGFADRTYEPDGSLTARTNANSVLQDTSSVVRRGVRLATEDTVVTTDGSEIGMRVDTICVHGDTPGAPELARALRAGLENAGVVISAIGGTPA